MEVPGYLWLFHMWFYFKINICTLSMQHPSLGVLHLTSSDPYNPVTHSIPLLICSAFLIAEIFVHIIHGLHRTVNPLGDLHPTFIAVIFVATQCVCALFLYLCLSFCVCMQYRIWACLPCFVGLQDWGEVCDKCPVWCWQSRSWKAIRSQGQRG